MAHLVPNIDQMEQFSIRLDRTEQVLLDALRKALDQNWTIYVKPVFNGHKPVFVIASQKAGIGIIEIDEYAGDGHEFPPSGWFLANRHRTGIFDQLFSDLAAHAFVDSSARHLVEAFVYFPNVLTDVANSTRGQFKYVTPIGRDALSPDKLREIIYKKLHSGFDNRRDNLDQYLPADRLDEVLNYGQNREWDVSDIMFTPSPGQAGLLSNEPGIRRVIGAAGSGKTLLLARKAFDAARDGKKVLMVCYNLTMINHISGIVRRLCMSEGAAGMAINKRIIVRNRHSIFKSDTALHVSDEDVSEMVPFDVLLIDEGQDFKREWVKELYQLAPSDDAHIMFVEDDRQNIYEIDAKARGSVPGIRGRPNQLKRSYRIIPEIAVLANRLVKWSSVSFESGDVEPTDPVQTSLFEWPKPVWVQGDRDFVESAFAQTIERLRRKNPHQTIFGDYAILVNSIEDGRDISRLLQSLKLRYTSNFELPWMYDQLAKKHGLVEGEAKTPERLEKEEKLDEDLERLRRNRKIGFLPQSHSINVCTIHSFKGLELKNVIVYFDKGPQSLAKVTPFLYTAITRAQESLMVFNFSSTLNSFGQIAVNEGLAVPWQ